MAEVLTGNREHFWLPLGSSNDDPLLRRNVDIADSADSARARLGGVPARRGDTRATASVGFVSTGKFGVMGRTRRFGARRENTILIGSTNTNRTQ